MSENLPEILSSSTVLIAGQHYSAFCKFPSSVEILPTNEQLSGDLAAIDVSVTLAKRNDDQRWIWLVFESAHDIVAGQVQLVINARGGMAVVSSELPGEETEWSLDLRDFPRELQGFGKKAKWVAAVIVVGLFILAGIYLWRK